jgi:hypothetical protein
MFSPDMLLIAKNLNLLHISRYRIPVRIHFSGEKSDRIIQNENK